MVIRGQVTKEKLELIYSTIHSVIKNKDCYYTQEEILKLKENANNVFFKERSTDEIHRY